MVSTKGCWVNSREQVLQVDTERRRIMIDAAQSTLDHLLAKELTWAHTSDSLESKAEFIETINEYKAIYEVLRSNKIRCVM